MMRTFPWLLAAAALAACGTPDDTTGAEDTDAVDTTPEVRLGLGHCTYVNLMGGGEECKDYTGSGWTEESAEANCDAPGFPAEPGTFTAGTLCSYDDLLGTCSIDENGEEGVVLNFPGTDGALCASLDLGCGFAAGTFVGTGACEGVGGGDTPGPVLSGQPFEPFEEVCVAEPSADDGEVCVWNAISGAVEPGYRFIDYGDCEAVRTQRPYVPYETDRTSDPEDPRLDDAAWMAEFDWFTSQVEATGCVCCHSTEAAPGGASGWYLEAEPIWLDTAGDEAVAMFAGWINSDAFGTFPAEDLYGFDRSVTGIPTTDNDRMLAFLEGELARRGLSKSDYADEPAWGGPLVTQLEFEPTACDENAGMNGDGELFWAGGGARYVYVLEADATNPTVPPNLDLPEGVLWRAQVGPDTDPMDSGVAYGTLPAGATQGFPESGAPEALVSGETYFLVALADIIQPRARCLFTAP